MAIPKIYTDPVAARNHLEKLLWPEGPVCPHCGNFDHKRIHKLKGKSTRPGVYKCRECEKPFTVTVGTVFEDSKVPLNKWVYAVHLLTSSKKGLSSHQLSRMLQVSYKTAWFMSHRIREAFRPAGPTPMGGEGQTVEIDETFIGRLEGQPKRMGGYAHKNIVLTLVERGGSARSFHIDTTSVARIVPIVRENVQRESNLMTDEARHYKGIGSEFASNLLCFSGVGAVTIYKKEPLSLGADTNAEFIMLRLAFLHPNTDEIPFCQLDHGLNVCFSKTASTTSSLFSPSSLAHAPVK